MKNSDINNDLLVKGEYCQKRSPGCFCKVGWPHERQCPNCREENDYRDSYCECPPKEEIIVLTNLKDYKIKNIR